MTHRRKQYLVYPPDYTPLKSRFKVRHSRRQATKTAIRMGAGAEIHCIAHIHPKPRTSWQTSKLHREWEIYRHD